MKYLWGQGKFSLFDLRPTQERYPALAMPICAAGLFAGCDNSSYSTPSQLLRHPGPQALRWNPDAPTNLPDTNAVGYKFHIGLVSQTYTITVIRVFYE